MGTLLYVFDDFEAARAARDELIRTGFGPECVRHESLAGEAGPTEGNFAVGGGRAPDGKPRTGITVGSESRYDTNFARVGTPSTQAVKVECRTASEQADAASIARRFGGRDYDVHVPRQC